MSGLLKPWDLIRTQRSIFMRYECPLTASPHPYYRDPKGTWLPQGTVLLVLSSSNVNDVSMRSVLAACDRGFGWVVVRSFSNRVQHLKSHPDPTFCRKVTALSAIGHRGNSPQSDTTHPHEE